MHFAPAERRPPMWVNAAQIRVVYPYKSTCNGTSQDNVVSFRMPITARLSFFTSRTAGFALICLVLAGFSNSACSKSPGTNSQQPTAEASAGGGGGAGRGGGRGGRGAGGGGPVPVVTAHAVAKAVPVTIPGVGTAEPLATVQIRAQVTGQLSKIHFAEGQEVQKGALSSR